MSKVTLVYGAGITKSFKSYNLAEGWAKAALPYNTLWRIKLN